MSIHSEDRSARQTIWIVAERILFATWVVAAAVTMYPRIGKALHIYGGFFSSYAADLSFPAWFYIILRRTPGRMLGAVRWFGSSPELAASSIFMVGLISEISQIYWPKGLFRGTYDPLDIVAYAVGPLICCIAEKRELRSREVTMPS